MLPFGILGVILLIAAYVNVSLALALLGGYAVLSLVTFAAYAADKSAARSGRFRTQESALHVLEVMGGWPGALVAQRRFRHKTVKRSFQVALRACVAANLVGATAVVALFASTPG